MSDKTPFGPAVVVLMGWCALALGSPASTWAQAGTTWFTGAEPGDPAMFTSAGPLVGEPEWQISDIAPFTGDWAFFSGPSDSAVARCASMSTPPLTLAAGEASVLRFANFVGGIEPNEGGLLEISTTGGLVWEPLTVTPPYVGSFPSAASNACGYPAGTPAFSGVVFTGFQATEADLSAYNGSTVLIRWVFSTNADILTSAGWMVDDIEVTHVLFEVFADGFESGDLSAWSQVVE